MPERRRKTAGQGQATRASDAIVLQASHDSNVIETHSNLDGSGSREADPATPAQAVPTVGRYDPCPCGIGKKDKQCYWTLA